MATEFIRFIREYDVLEGSVSLVCRMIARVGRNEYIFAVKFTFEKALGSKISALPLEKATKIAPASLIQHVAIRLVSPRQSPSPPPSSQANNLILFPT
jgi:hypothetical protein